eukprot:UN12467
MGSEIHFRIICFGRKLPHTLSKTRSPFRNSKSSKVPSVSKEMGKKKNKKKIYCEWETSFRIL